MSDPAIGLDCRSERVLDYCDTHVQGYVWPIAQHASPKVIGSFVH